MSPARPPRVIEAHACALLVDLYAERRTGHAWLRCGRARSRKRHCHLRCCRQDRRRRSQEVGIGQPTLSRRLREATTLPAVTKRRKRPKNPNPAAPVQRRPEERSPEDKLRLVLGAGALADADLGELLLWRLKIGRSPLRALVAANCEPSRQRISVRINEPLQRWGGIALDHLWVAP